MSHVFILSAFLTPFRSGAEACAEEVALALCDRFDVTIITAKMRGDLPRRDLLKGKVPVIRVGVGLPLDKWLYPFLAPFAARRLKPDVLHAVLETFAGLALFISRFMMRGVHRILTLQTTNRRFLRGPIIRSAHRVTAISSVLFADAARLGAHNVTIIPNGADIDGIRSVTRSVPKVPGRLLFVGRLEPMKGVDVLLRAVASLPKDAVWHLRVVGGGSQRSMLESLAVSLGIADRVTFTGYLKEEALWKEYAEAEIFCGLSRSEALGNVFIEAQAAGCVVIATRVGGIPDIVHDGETGILVPVDDVQAAAAALSRVLAESDLRGALSTKTQASVETYRWTAIATQYASIYEATIRR